MFAVCVTLKIHAGKMDAFLPLMHANAAASLETETGCHRFDVCREQDEVFLYELYTDAASFQTHLETAHFKAFDAETAALVADKQVKTYTSVHS